MLLNQSIYMHVPTDTNYNKNIEKRLPTLELYDKSHGNNNEK